MKVRVNEHVTAVTLRDITCRPNTFFFSFFSECLYL